MKINFQMNSNINLTQIFINFVVVLNRHIVLILPKLILVIFHQCILYTPINQKLHTHNSKYIKHFNRK